MDNALSHVTVATVISQQGKFLFVKEMQQGQLVINQPAGHVEFGENLIDAALRETYEETGLRCHAKHFIGCYTLHLADAVYYRFAFHCELAPGQDIAKAQPLDDDISATTWLSEQELFAQKQHWRSELVGAAVSDFVAGQRYDLDIVKEFRK